MEHRLSAAIVSEWFANVSERSTDISGGPTDARVDRATVSEALTTISEALTTVNEDRATTRRKVTTISGDWATVSTGLAEVRGGSPRFGDDTRKA